MTRFQPFFNTIQIFIGNLHLTEDQKLLNDSDNKNLLDLQEILEDSIDKKLFNTPFDIWLIKNQSAKFYKNSEVFKENIYKENKANSGIYLWLCNINNKYYIGSAKDFRIRLKNYYSSKHLRMTDNLIQRALIKHQHLNFSFYILEYCEIENLISREQYYLDLLVPQYNILKVAGSSLGYKHSKEIRLKLNEIQKNKKGINHQRYRKLNSEETKALRAKQVFVYSNDNPSIILFELSSYTNARKHFNCNRQTIANNIDTKKLFKKKWFLFSKLIT